MLTLRRPAPADFLARRHPRVAAFPPGSRGWLVAICRAELDWADAEWRRLGGRAEKVARHGPHPAEAWRLPHERQAARLVNCHLHVDAESHYLHLLLRRLPAQRIAAADASQTEAFRAHWAEAADGTLRDLRNQRLRRALAWRAFLEAATHYTRLRAAIDHAALMQGPPSQAAA